MNTIKSIKKEYEKVVKKYIYYFSKQQNLNFDGWVGDEIGGIAWFGDIAFNFSDIMMHLNTNQPKENIIQWHFDNIENHQKTLINYKSYIMGLRIKDMPPPPTSPI